MGHAGLVRPTEHWTNSTWPAHVASAHADHCDQSAASAQDLLGGLASLRAIGRKNVNDCLCPDVVLGTHRPEHLFSHWAYMPG